jgi:hypothetical protein
MAKLYLNSMWGKLTERNNRTKVKLIKDPHELYRFLATPGIEVANLVFASDEMVWASWSFLEEDVPNLRHTNEVVGSYVTRRSSPAPVLLSRQVTTARDLLRHRQRPIRAAER